jgi:hypothetical protein
MHSDLLSMLTQCKQEPEKYSQLLPLIENEYLYMMKSFTLEKSWSVVDLGRESTKGGQGIQNPITFGDFTMENGEKVPTETVLCSSEDDWCSM